MILNKFLRIVIRNRRGDVFGSTIVINSYILTVFVAEALACLQAVRLGLDLGLQEVVIEGDALTMVKKLQKNRRDESIISAYIEDSKSMCLNFRKCVAHLVATERLRREWNTYLLRGVSNFAVDAVENDYWKGFWFTDQFLEKVQLFPWKGDDFGNGLMGIHSSSNSFLAAITYAGGVPIWIVGDGTTIDSDGSLRLLSNGALHLVNGFCAVVWDFGTTNQGVYSASLEYSGELYLLRNGSSAVWSSFDHPTDTIIPTELHYCYSDTSPICGCPSENFRLLDVNDMRQRCKRKRDLEDCPGSAAMSELDHAESFTYPPELSSQTFFVGISACRLNCLVTASCVASTSLSDGTSSFKEKLGARGFGAVYKGVLSNRAVVAVKQLEGIKQGKKQFRMEVATISGTHHLNLVRLIGFCAEGHHRLLVYEFMKNESLDNFLFTTEELSGKMLSWEYHCNVALGTTRGIIYGMVLSEIASGRRNFDVSAGTNRKKFSIWAYEEFEKGNIEGIVDKKLVNQDVDMEQITRAIQGSTINEIFDFCFLLQHTDPTPASHICNVLGFNEVSDLGTYLGMLLFHRRLTTSMFKFVLDKIRKRLDSWDAKIPSMAGRIILVRSVLMAIQATLRKLL
ncbi:hypothetical protein J1N35_017842 [Gossypium stocksii]|uniref:Protein kinase domain-containing protein n=1 Tax=Gossypium stocksii TaxID=47602 RepID=A0A9D3VPD8_9ROSI|nr:hypothetical protein J1N35_017842 [Gossypium stocksii]